MENLLAFPGEHTNILIILVIITIRLVLKPI